MHPNAIQNLNSRINGSLQNCDIENTWPKFSSYTSHVEKLANEVLKFKKDWLTDLDIYSIFIDLVYSAIISHKPENTELNGKLNNILNDAEFSALEKNISSYIQSIPRTYKAYFPLPSITGLNKNINISSNFTLENNDFLSNAFENMHYNSLSSFGNHENKTTQHYLTFEIKGYCSSNSLSSTPVNALNTFKITMQQAISKNFFSRKNNTASGLGLIWANQTHTIPKYQMIFIDQNESVAKKIKLELPMEICRLLESHAFDQNNSDIKLIIAQNQIDTVIKTMLNDSALLHSTELAEAKRIKAAIIWAFDSYINDNQTMSFIQNCIGLEALYGDEDDQENLTKTLSDRCAYLISNNIKGRKAVREKFRKLYSIRSKIIHGNATTLAESENDFLRWGNSILQYSITKEIKHLELEKIVNK